MISASKLAMGVAALTTALVACSGGPGGGGFRKSGSGWFGKGSSSEGNGYGTGGDSYGYGTGGDYYGSGGDSYGSGGSYYGSGGDSYGSGGSYYGSGGSVSGSYCGGATCAPDEICVRHTDGSLDCLPECQPVNQGSDCYSGCCGRLESGRYVCEDSSYCCGNEGLACGAPNICVSFSDGTKACGAPCVSAADCPGGCCNVLQSGRYACVPSYECN